MTVRSLMILLLLPISLSAAEPSATEPKAVSYYKDIRPIFQIHCTGCHQPAKPLGSYLMTAHADLFKVGDRGEAGIVAGKPEQSLLLKLVTPQNGKVEMPKGREPLSEHQVQLIRRWIAAGAKDDTPKSATDQAIDPDHPPTYVLPPVITALAYSPDNSLLAVSGYHEVLLHKADGSGLVARLVGQSERIQAIAFSPNGQLLAVAGGSPGRFGEVQIWEVAKKKLKLSVPITYDTLYGVSWSPSGDKIAFGCADNTLRAIDAVSGKQVLFQGAHSDWVLGTTFTRDGLFLVSVSRDRSMKLTEVETQRFIDNITSITPGALKGGLASVSLRPRSDKLMSKIPPDTPNATAQLYEEVLVGGSDGTPRLYKVHREAKRVIGDDFNKIREYEKLPGRIYATAFKPDGALFAVGSSFDGKGEVRVYETDSGKRVATIEKQPGAVYALAFSPDGQRLAVAGFDGMVRLSDPTTGKLLSEFSPIPKEAMKAGR